jgi:hypothetical protein
MIGFKTFLFVNIPTSKILDLSVEENKETQDCQSWNERNEADNTPRRLERTFVAREPQDLSRKIDRYKHHDEKNPKYCALTHLLLIRQFLE